MSQVTEYIIGSSPLTMAQLKTELDNYFAAMGSLNKGSTAPSNPFDGMYWIDDSATPWLIKIYDTTNGWTTTASLDVTTGIFTPYYNGTPNLPLGVGQTWQDVLSSRSAGVIYTNNTGRSIEIFVASTNTAADGFLSISIDSLGPQIFVRRGAASGSAGGGTFVIPSGSTYEIDVDQCTIEAWWELR